MTQEDKELLLKDLSARLPYGVKVQSTFYYCDGTVWKHEDETLTSDLLSYPIHRYKPYLFPMSSMTEEQKKELEDTLVEMELKAISDEIKRVDVAAYEIDFYNKYHIDYRGLIEKSLALDATGLNIY